jgi:hypothetical protein
LEERPVRQFPAVQENLHPLMQSGIFGARAETRMEMAGAAARIGEKQKRGREGFCHLPPVAMAYF